MSLIGNLLLEIPDGKVLDVRIGLHWTAVVVEVAGQQRCGLSSTLARPHDHGGEPVVPKAGSLKGMSARDLAGYASDEGNYTLASIGVAAINALLPTPQPDFYIEGNAEDFIAKYGSGKRVVIVGHFPFVSRLRPRVGKLDVLSLEPRDGDLPAEAAPDVLPSADIIAITGQTLINHTLESLLSMCLPTALIMVLGPSTSFSEVLFDYGVDLLSGSIVLDIGAVLDAVSEGGDFRQIHRAGVQLVIIERPGFSNPLHGS